MRYCIVIVGFAVLLAAANAEAQAKEHFMAGQSYYTQGRYEKAIEEFEEAYRLDPKPLLLYNIAQSHEKLGNLKEAVDFLERFLKDDPDTDQKKSLEDKIKNLKARLAATGIKVECNVDGAKIYVNDKEVGKTPVEGVIALDEGSHKVKISRPGYKDFVMPIAVSTGHSVKVEATLESDGSGAAVAPPPEDDDDADVDDDDTEPVDQAKEDDGKKGGGFIKVLPWIVAGVGAVTAGVGWGVVGTMAANEEDHSKAVVADIIGFSGSAIAVGGLVWGIVSIVKSKKESAASAAVVVPYAAENQAGLSATFTF